MTTLMLPVLAQGDVITPLPPPPPWVMMNPAAITLVASVFLAVVFMLALPLVRALARRLEGRTAPDPALTAEVEELRARVAELELHQGRVHELEERIDFTERLLAQQREQARLPH